MIGSLDKICLNNAGPNLKIAFVGTQENIKTVSEVYSSTMSSDNRDTPVKIFYDMEEAKEWVKQN